jgi:hypothetical protein
LLEKKKHSEHCSENKKCENKKPHCKHTDDAINDACSLSDLRKPAQMITKTDEEDQTQKKSKCKKLSPIVLVKIECATGKKNRKTKAKIVKAPADAGASALIATFKSAKGSPLNKKTETKKWSTATGVLNTSAKTKLLQFNLLELQSARKIEKSFHVADIELKNYDMTIGRDLITGLQPDVKGSNMSIKWDDAAIPWRNVDSAVEDICLAEDHQSYQPADQEMNRMNEILDAKHSKADPNEVTESADHLTTSEKQKLLPLTKKYEDFFNGTLGAFTGAPCDVKLKDNVEPHHARPFPVPKIHELTLKSELDRSCELNVLKRVNRSQWGAPTFIVPKKDGTVRFISDFRELNKRISQTPAASDPEDSKSASKARRFQMRNHAQNGTNF